MIDDFEKGGLDLGIEGLKQVGGELGGVVVTK